MKKKNLLLKLITDENIAAIDPHNKRIYLKREDREDALKLSAHGYEVYTIGEIRFVARYVMPEGCSPAHVEHENTAVTALHCVSSADMRPRKSATLLVIDSSLPEVAKINASLKDYTPVKKCGIFCKLLIFFRMPPKGYINLREVAWVEAPISLKKYEPLPELEAVGVITATNDKGDFMLFSPLPNKEDKVQAGNRIAYIAFNYAKNRLEYVETVIAGYAFTNLIGYIFYLPYAYEPGRTLALPGFSGSAVKLKNIKSYSRRYYG